MSRRIRQKTTRTWWTKPRQLAALEVAKDERTDAEIAELCGVHRDTLDTWKNQAVFKSRVEEHHETWRRELKARGIAEKQNRVDALNDRWGKMQQLIKARGASAKMKRVAGGTTGLLAHQVRGIGGGDNFKQVDHYEVDTGLLREMREHEKQAAQELGQWVERVQNFDLTKLTDAQLERIAAGEDPLKVVLGG